MITHDKSNLQKQNSIFDTRTTVKCINNTLVYRALEWMDDRQKDRQTARLTKCMNELMNE